ncbi:MAG: hypothetical protein PWQ28_290 [Candidatus Woesearchaeota archaeon]|nr:hypothetical protein [Candidatus Woesearchaeota archaeon]
MTDKIKKSYDPFKMWGSWIGLVIGISSLFWLPNTHINFSKFNTDFLPIIFLFLFFGIIGFLFGWGVHSLIRKQKADS